MSTIQWCSPSENLECRSEMCSARLVGNVGQKNRQKWPSGHHRTNFAALLHGTLVVGVSQTLRRWTEGATYIRQGGHHVQHWPTFLVCSCVVMAAVCNMADHMFLCCGFFFFLLSFFFFFSSPILSRRKLDVYHTSTHDVALMRMHVSTIGKELVKQQYLLHMSSQNGEVKWSE